MASPDTSRLRCPILQSLMKDPVVASDGHTYERVALERWFQIHTNSPTSPMTGEPFASKSLIPNHAIRASVQDIIEQFPTLAEELTSVDDISTIHATTPPPPPLDATASLPVSATLDPLSIARSLRVLSASRSSLGYDGHEVLGLWRPLLPSGSGGADADDMPLLEANTMSMYLSSTRSAPVMSVQPKIATVSASDSSSQLLSSSTQGESDPMWSGKLATSVHGHHDLVTCLRSAYIDEQRVLFSSSKDGTVFLWAFDEESETLKMIPTGDTFRHHSEGVLGLAVLEARNGPMGVPLVATGSRDKSVCVWKYEQDLKATPLETGWSKIAIIRNAHSDFVTCCDFQKTSGQLATGGADWELKLWDVQAANLEEPLRKFRGHSYAVRCCSWGGSSVSNAPLLASGGDDEKVIVWDPRLKYGAKVATLKTGAAVLCCSWGTDNSGNVSWLAAGGGTDNTSFNASSSNVDGYVRVWDPRTWKPLVDLCSVEGGITSASDIKSSTSLLSSGTESSSGSRGMSLLDYKSRRTEGDSVKERRAHAGAVTDVWQVHLQDKASADGQQQAYKGLVSCGGDRQLRFWKLPDPDARERNAICTHTLSGVHNMDIDACVVMR